LFPLTLLLQNGGGMSTFYEGFTETALLKAALTRTIGYGDRGDHKTGLGSHSHSGGYFMGMSGE
jgi:hypothetical protein